jgi:uncharacterized membrane protein YdjX (TVP38/TMEM64 family)
MKVLLPSRGARARPARIKPLNLRELPWMRIGFTVAAIAIVAFAIYRQLDIELIHARAAQLNGLLAFALLTLLPLAGFPVSVLHVAAGIRFGILHGLALVALSIFLQLLASYALVHLFRERFERRLARWRGRFPQGSHASLCVLAVLLPGAPFAAINYVLPLIGVPLRTYLLCCLPLHVLRSTITVTFGDQSDQLTPTRLAVLTAYGLSIATASWWTYRRLERKLGGRPAAEGDRRQPA